MQWDSTRPLTFKENFERPKSYFLCLLVRESVIGKGAPGIPHDACDNYYKRIMDAPAASLPRRLQGINGKNNDEVKKHRGLVLGDAVEDSDPEDEEAQEQPALVAPADADILVPTAARVGLSRVVADQGPGSFALKVYFDNNSHQQGRQRGLCSCCTLVFGISS